MHDTTPRALKRIALGSIKSEPILVGRDLREIGDGTEVTLLVAIKVPTKLLNPMRRPLRFSEPGIVIAADTRFTFVGGGAEDDAQKLWPLSDTAAVGYAGDVAVAERSILSAHTAIREYGFSGKAKFERTVLSTYLRHWHDFYSKRREISRTVVFMGQLLNSGRCKMYSLDSDTKFILREKSGIIIDGSGAEYFEKLVDREIDLFTKQWCAPIATGLKIVEIDGKLATEPREKNDLIEIPLLKVATLITSVADTAINEPGIPTVGGWTQLTTLSRNGFYHPKAKSRSMLTGEWRDVTRSDLRSFNEMEGGGFLVPYVDRSGQLGDGPPIRVKVWPGDITGRRNK